MRGVRGAPDTTAELAAETVVTVLQIALTRWIEDPDERPWEGHVRAAVDELRGLTAGAPASMAARPLVTGQSVSACARRLSCLSGARAWPGPGIPLDSRPIISSSAATQSAHALMPEGL